MMGTKAMLLIRFFANYLLLLRLDVFQQNRNIYLWTLVFLVAVWKYLILRLERDSQGHTIHFSAWRSMYPLKHSSSGSHVGGYLLFTTWWKGYSSNIWAKIWKPKNSVQNFLRTRVVNAIALRQGWARALNKEESRTKWVQRFRWESDERGSLE